MARAPLAVVGAPWSGRGSPDGRCLGLGTHFLGILTDFLLIFCSFLTDFDDIFGKFLARFARELTDFDDIFEKFPRALRAQAHVYTLGSENAPSRSGCGFSQ